MSDLNYTLIDLDFPAGDKNKTAVLVTGETDAMLFDAGFTRADGHRLVAAVLDSGKHLTQVIISSGDPDYYFGLEVLADAFPDAEILATQEIIDHIKATYEGKLVAWASSGNNLPTRLVDITPLDGDITFEHHTFELRRVPATIPGRDYFWEAQSRSILGGVLLFQNQHVWVADTPSVQERKAWIHTLDEMNALDPAITYPGHRVPTQELDTSPIAYTRDYLETFDEILAASPTGAAATEQLVAAYPDAGLLVAAQLGAKVAKGEMEWH